MNRITAVLVAAAVAVSATAAVPASTDADRPASARTTVRLTDVGIDAPMTDRLTAALGDLQLVSGRLDGPAQAALGLVGADVMGTEVGAWGRSTTDGDHRGDASVPVSAAGIDGAVQLLAYAVEASARDARSQVTGLDGRLAAGPVALRLGSGDRGIVTRIEGDASNAATSLSLASVDLRLGDLLPADLLDRLPLGVLLELHDRLPVTLPTVESVLEQFEELVAGLREVSEVVARITETREQLLALVDGDPAVAAAAEVVAAAETALADAQEQLATAVDARDAARSTLEDAESDLAAAVAATDELQAELDAAVAARDTATQAVTAARAELDAAEAQLAAAASALDAAVSQQAAARAVVDGLEAELLAVETTIAELEAELLTLDPTDPDDLLREAEIAAELLELDDEVERIEAALVTANATLATETDAVTGAQEAVAAASADVASHRAALASAEEVLADAGADLAAVRDALADASSGAAAARDAITDAQAALSSAQDAVDEARAAATTAQQTLDDALNELDRILVEVAETLGDIATESTERLTWLRGELDGVLDRVRTLAIALPDLGDLLDELRAALADVPIVSLGQLGITIELAADARSATAVVDCRLGSLTVLGEIVQNPTCARANELISGVPQLLADLLSALPVELPVPSVSGLDIRTTATDRPDADGVTRAAAAVTGLRVQVPSVTLAGIVDDLTAELERLLATALAAEGLLGSTPVLSPLGATRPAADPVSDAFGQLQAQLGGLPVGVALEGVRTVGIESTVASLQSEVLSGAAVLDPLDVDEPLPGLTTDGPEDRVSMPPTGSPDPAADPDAPSGAPGDPDTAGPSLPNTGGGVVLLPVALMLGGLLLRRRR